MPAPDPDAWLAPLPGQARRPKTPDETPWGKLLLADYREVITRLPGDAGGGRGESCRVDDVLQEKYAPALQADLAQLDRLAGAVTWEGIRAAHQLEGFIPLARAGQGRQGPGVNRAQIQAAAQVLQEKESADPSGLPSCSGLPAAETRDLEQAQCSRAIRGLVQLDPPLCQSPLAAGKASPPNGWISPDLEQETLAAASVPPAAQVPPAIAREVSQTLPGDHGGRIPGYQPACRTSIFCRHLPGEGKMYSSSAT